MTHLPKFCPAIVSGMGTAAVIYFIASFVFVVIAKTVLPAGAPIEVTNIQPETIRHHDDIHLNYEKNTSVRQATTVKVIRTIVHTSGITLQLPMETRIYRKTDEENRVRPAILHKEIPSGKWRMETSYLYTPPFSMVEQRVDAEPFEFSVCAEEKKICKNNK